MLVSAICCCPQTIQTLDWHEVKDLVYRAPCSHQTHSGNGFARPATGSRAPDNDVDTAPCSTEALAKVRLAAIWHQSGVPGSFRCPAAPESFSLSYVPAALSLGHLTSRMVPSQSELRFPPVELRQATKPRLLHLGCAEQPTCSILLGLKVDQPPVLQEGVELTDGSHVTCSHTRGVSPRTVSPEWHTH